MLRARAIMTVFYIPAIIILYLVRLFLPNVWMIAQDNGDGTFTNVGDTIALEHAQTFIQYYFVGTYFSCLNDLQIRFLNAMGKQKIVLVCQIVTFIMFIAVGFLIIVEAEEGIKGAGHVHLYF